MMTEEEAKTRWCPFGRKATLVEDLRAEYAYPASAASTNYGCLCMASQCMAWRWVRKPNPNWKPEAQSWAMPLPRDIRNDPPMYIEDTTRGFCGLAGRAEV